MKEVRVDIAIYWVVITFLTMTILGISVNFYLDIKLVRKDLEIAEKNTTILKLTNNALVNDAIKLEPKNKKQ